MMIKAKHVLFVMLLAVPMLVAGCTDTKKLDTIEQNQKDILAKLGKMEQAQINMAKAFKPSSKPTVDYNKVYNMPIGKSAVKGKMDASVTIVEFSDFQCPYCSRLQPTLQQVLDAYPNDVKLVFKDFPLSFHKQAKNAAKAARAAGEQGKYWEMHDLIFKDFNKLTDNSYKDYATRLNLDVAKFEADYKSNQYDKLIQDDINLGRGAGVTGTPTLYMNGKRMQKRSFDDFKSSVDGYLKKK